MSEKNNTLKLTTPGDLEIVFTREFSAPRQLVWDAHTRPELVKRWLLGPGGWSMPLCEIDLRAGGAWRYGWRHTDGQEMAMGGVFLEVDPPSRLVNTEKFDEPWYPGEAVNVMVFDDLGGRTLMTLTIRYESKEARDAALKSGMDEGMAAGYDNLDKLLAG
ncbi:MAG TPA: SRPBCC family protein [Opitutaceae bacterium]